MVVTSIIAFVVWANWPEKPQLKPGQTADLIIIDKYDRTLNLFDKQGLRIAVYQISLGQEPGMKTQEGDNKTPEGVYMIDYHKSDSAFHKALHLDYPNEDDKKAGRTGSNIMIHGIRNGLGFLGRAQSWVDWSAGCISLNNRDMDEVFAAVQDGTRVRITSAERNDKNRPICGPAKPKPRYLGAWAGKWVAANGDYLIITLEKQNKYTIEIHDQKGSRFFEGHDHKRAITFTDKNGEIHAIMADIVDDLSFDQPPEKVRCLMIGDTESYCRTQSSYKK